MRWLPGPFRKIFRHWEKLQRFVRGVIAKHKENLDQSDLGDYIDCYLKEIEKVRGKYLRPLKAWSPKRADKTQGNFVRRAFSFLTSFTSDFLAAAGVWSLWKRIDFYMYFFHLEAFKLYLLFLILSTGIGGLSGNLFMFLWEFVGGCFGFGLGFWKHPLPNKHFYCLFFYVSLRMTPTPISMRKICSAPHWTSSWLGQRQQQPPSVGLCSTWLCIPTFRVGLLMGPSSHNPKPDKWNRKLSCL